MREATAPDASPEPSDRGPGVAVTGGGDAGSGPDAAPTAVQRDRSQAPRIAFDEGALDLGTVGVDLIGEFEVWTVPAATLGVPGILLLVWVALQTVGALAWIPAVRRLRDAEDAPE